MFRFAILVCLAAILPHMTAGAASFDCAKASAPREKVICSDPILSEADTHLNELYQSAMSKLSKEGGALLRDNQREWLHYLAQWCPIQPSVGQQANIAIMSCLGAAYSERIRDLEQAAVSKGPFLFSRVDHYSVTDMGTASVVGDNGHARHQLSYPRIDQPITPFTILWNQAAIQADSVSGCDSGKGDTWTGYSLGLVTSRLISVTWTVYEYCHGTPHGFDSSSVETQILLPTPHPLQPDDLFRPDSAWREQLTTLLLAELRNAAVAGQYDLAWLDEAVIANTVPDPQHWLVRSNGLAIQFDTYELGLGRSFNPDVTIPWTSLRDVMVSDPPVQ